MCRCPQIFIRKYVCDQEFELRAYTYYYNRDLVDLEILLNVQSVIRLQQPRRFIKV